jgi:uncharacterized protein (TIGR03118 family)
MGTMGGASVLFAANKATGKIDVFDSTFNPVTLPSTAFADSAVPTGLTPYNIQIVNGSLYVEYSGPRGSPGGFVAEFDTNGTLIQAIGDPHLNAPWAIVMAPSGFGDFGDDLLIGNFNDGMINAFNPSTGAFLGTLMDGSGHPIADPGLWALEFRNTSAPNANTGNNPNTLFFVAGINNEAEWPIRSDRHRAGARHYRISRGRSVGGAIAQAYTSAFILKFVAPWARSYTWSLMLTGRRFPFEDPAHSKALGKPREVR